MGSHSAPAVGAKRLKQLREAGQDEFAEYVRRRFGDRFTDDAQAAWEQKTDSLERIMKKMGNDVRRLS
jgi:hypothetical protein